MNKKANYRITFHDGPLGKTEKNVDIYAENTADAFKQAFQMLEAYSHAYTGIIVDTIPKGPSVIGVHFECTDTAFNDTTSNYIYIKATSEEDAVDFYNLHLKGKRFQYDRSKPVEKGRYIFGKVKGTYFAVGTGYEIDATA